MKSENVSYPRDKFGSNVIEYSRLQCNEVNKQCIDVSVHEVEDRNYTRQNLAVKRFSL